MNGARLFGTPGAYALTTALLSLLRRGAAAIFTGLTVSAVVFAVFFVTSDGRDPDFVCEFVSGDAGLLPLNPGFGEVAGQVGDHSCDPNFLGFASSALAPAILISVVTYLTLVGLAWRRPTSDLETP